MRDAYGRPPLYPWQQSCTLEDRLNIAIFNGYGNSQDAVLAFCVAMAEKFPEIAERLDQEAFSSYRRRTKAYDQILGELIPREFHDEVHSLVAREAYLDGTHVTAKADWTTA